jgi:TonB family protein
LSSGFLNLAEAELRRRDAVVSQPTPEAAPAAVASTSVAAMAGASPPAAAPAPTPDAPIAAAAADTSASAGTVYSESDAAVDPPAELSRRLPAWNPPPALARMEFRGVLEVVIDEQGAVTTASLASPVHPAYDDPLLAAASRWRFRPATRDGVPVPYRKTFEIVLNRR